MHQTTVGVLRGGPSRKHAASLKSGHAILSHMSAERFTARDIYIDQYGIWHDRGLPTTPGRILSTIDIAVTTLHGAYGQDGEVQKILEQFGVPYTGADSFHSFHSGHVLLAKEQAIRAGISSPRYRFADRHGDAERLVREAVRAFLQPVVVKSADTDSSEGVFLVNGYKPVLDAVTKLFNEGARGVLVEEYIQGKEVNVGIIEGLRGEDLYALPPMEIIFDENNGRLTGKLSNRQQSVSLARLPRDMQEKLMAEARTLHQALGQRHYSCSDFIVSNKGTYFIKTTSASGVDMTEESRIPQSLAAVGVKVRDFLEHVIDRALAK